MKMQFPIRFREPADDWRVDESENLLEEKKIESIRRVLDSEGSIVIEHWIYRGSQAPKRRVFDDLEGFVGYLVESAHAGDIVDVWSLHSLITSSNRLVSGKCPADDGTVPRTGSY